MNESNKSIDEAWQSFALESPNATKKDCFYVGSVSMLILISQNISDRLKNELFQKAEIKKLLVDVDSYLMTSQGETPPPPNEGN